ncbi:hypothetical protein WDW86_05300 [Bdellovibrionota bacterium FG-2]
MFRKICKHHTSLSLTIALAALATSSGCGKQAFVVTSSVEDQKSPGFFTIAPKVDFLLIEDDTGSMHEPLANIQAEMPPFLTGLEAKGWNTHFATIPLTTPRAITQVMASKHDGNWGSAWISPYPGSTMSDPGTLLSSVFRTSDQYDQFITQDTITKNSGQEEAFKNIAAQLKDPSLTDTSFLRDDALFVMIVLGNGDDTSDVAMCTRSDGFKGPCELVGFPDQGTLQTSFDHYKGEIAKAKSSAEQLKLFSIVSANKTSNCAGGYAYAGLRYMQMAKDLGGVSYDVCSVPMKAILQSLASQLQVTRVAFQTRYLLLASEPNPATIEVKKNIAGSADNSVIIAQDVSNGWTYKGRISNEATIDYPIPMNEASGFAIELHGDAKLHGDDTASVTFKPVGAENSAK